MAEDDKPIEQEMEEELSRVPNTTGWLGKKAVRTATVSQSTLRVKNGPHLWIRSLIEYFAYCVAENEVEGEILRTHAQSTKA